MVDRFHHPVATAPPDQSYPGGRARPIALNPGVPGQGLQIPRPPHQAAERATPFSSIRLCSSPASNISIMMSSEEHTSELQSLTRISYAVFCLKKKITHIHNTYVLHQ